MPSSNLTPASGVATTAKDQLLKQLVLVLQGENVYLTFADVLAEELDRQVRTYVSCLPNLTIRLFLMPEYDDGQTTWRARNNIEWRPVGDMPSFQPPPIADVVFSTSIPLAAPSLLLVGVPVTFSALGTALGNLSLEFRIPEVEDLPEDQGHDMVVISISASA